MGEVTLTTIFFICLFSVFAIVNAFNLYVGFASVNNITIEDKYSAAFQNITSKYSDLNNLSVNISSPTSAQNIFDAAKSATNSVINVFVTGLSSIGMFFSMIPIIGSLFSTITEIFPLFNILLGSFITLIIGVYIAMAYIKAASNKSQLP
jgi:hypothetical protein